MIRCGGSLRYARKVPISCISWFCALWCCVLILSPLLVNAAELNFTASVDSTQVPLGDYFQITFTLEGKSGGKNFQPPSFHDFDVLSGPNQSTSVQITNGAMSSSISYTYVLQPRKEGTFTIDPAMIEAGGQKLETRQITIEVVKGSGATPGLSSRPTRSGEIPKIGDNLLLKAIVDKTSAFQGEQITVRYKLYTRVPIDNYGMTKTPALTGFWSEDLQPGGKVPVTTEVLNGKEYRVATMKSVALFAQKSGTLKIDPMELECVVPVQRRSGDVFDQFFNPTSSFRYRVASEPVEIRIELLPANPPAGFSGAVGKFDMEVTLDKRKANTNDPVTLRVEINGHGNLKLFGPPNVTIPPDLDRFDPKITSSIRTEGGTVSGSRTFEYLLIPRHEGEQKIPSVPFAYFDVGKKAYVPSHSPELVIDVQRGPESGSTRTAIPAWNQENVQVLGEDIRFIKSANPAFIRSGQGFVASNLFFILYLGSPLVFTLFVFLVKRREKFESDQAIRIRKARKMAKKRLSKAHEFLKAKKKEDFYAEVSRALWGYLADKLSLAHSELSMEGARTALLSRGVPESIAAAMLSAIDECEFARFAPSSDSIEMDRIWESAVKLVAGIEEELR